MQQVFYDWNSDDVQHSSRTNNRGASSPLLPTHIVSQRGYIKDVNPRGPETYFRLSDVPDEDYTDWKRLQNRDKNNLNNDGKATWLMKYDEVSALVSKLRLSDGQENEIVAVTMTTDASPYSSYGGVRALALAVAVDVVNRVRQRYDSFELGDRLEEDDRFKELAERNDVDITPAKKKYKRRMREWRGSTASA